MNRPHIIPYCGKEKPASHNAQTVAKGTDRKYKKWKNDFVRNAYREKEEYREKHIGNHRTINGLSHPSKNMALPHIQKKRAVNETRTRDPWLGKPMLYQLSYYRISIANLSTFSHLQKKKRDYILFFYFLAGWLRMFSISEKFFSMFNARYILYKRGAHLSLSSGRNFLYLSK